jgi:hypothetical protein
MRRRMRRTLMSAKQQGRSAMPDQLSIGLIALVATFAAVATARAFDEAKYPDLKGQWIAVGVTPDTSWDSTKPPGRGQQAPLTEEYQKKFEDILARHAQDGAPLASCIPPGMPRAMIGYSPMEIIVMPYRTNIMLGDMSEIRRIFTDGRKWSDEIEPAYSGYSIGAWEDTDGDGRYDTLVVETRAMKSPHTFDSSGLPLHEDNDAVVKEKIYLDKNDQDVLHDEITTIDHALTRPWTVTRSYRRERNAVWNEVLCSEDNRHVKVGVETYTVSDDGFLMPTRKGQPRPDLRYFSNKK